MADESQSEYTPADFDDPEQWVVEPGLPVLTAHEAAKITDDDLPEIAANSNKLESEGRHSIQTLGHRMRPKDYPEQNQPPVVGAWRNFKMGTNPEGRPAVVADSWVHKKRWPEARKHPFRSAEYNPERKAIMAVSRLTREPEMSLGGLHYFSAQTDPVNFAAGTSAMDATNAALPNADETKEMETFAKCAAYMKKRWPKHFAFMDEESADDKRNDPGKEGFKETGAASETKEDSPMKNMASDGQLVMFQKQLADVKKENEILCQHVNAMLAEKSELVCFAALEKLDANGVIYDRERTAAKLKKMAPADRDAEVQDMLQFFARKTTYSAPIQGIGHNGPQPKNGDPDRVSAVIRHANQFGFTDMKKAEADMAAKDL